MVSFLIIFVSRLSPLNFLVAQVVGEKIRQQVEGSKLCYSYRYLGYTLQDCHLDIFGATKKLQRHHPSTPTPWRRLPFQSRNVLGSIDGLVTFTLPKTNIAPENRLGPKRKRSSSNHPFSGATLVGGRVPLKIHPKNRLANIPWIRWSVPLGAAGSSRIHPT